MKKKTKNFSLRVALVFSIICCPKLFFVQAGEKWKWKRNLCSTISDAGWCHICLVLFKFLSRHFCLTEFTWHFKQEPNKTYQQTSSPLPSVLLEKLNKVFCYCFVEQASPTLFQICRTGIIKRQDFFYSVDRWWTASKSLRYKLNVPNSMFQKHSFVFYPLTAPLP